MLQAIEDTCDYVLHVTSDDQHFLRIHCHKAVLRCHSPRFSELMTGANYSELEVKLPVGFFGAFIELVQYMYLRDIHLISHAHKVMQLCAMFDMPFDIFLIRTGGVQPINTYASLTFTLTSDRQPEEHATCITAVDFLRHVEFHHAHLKVQAGASDTTEESYVPPESCSVSVQTEAAAQLSTTVSPASPTTEEVAADTDIRVRPPSTRQRPVSRRAKHPRKSHKN